jgi:beta-lactamase regulating signal transducer with metallopeptidase domain
MDAVMNWLWQGAVVAIVAVLMLLVLQRASATARYAVCWAASLLILALPVLPLLSSAEPAADALLPTQTEAMVSLPDAWWTSTLVLLALWFVWGSVQLGRLVSAVVAIRRARARSHAFPAHLEPALTHWRRLRRNGRRTTLVLSHSVKSAAVLGWGSPMIAVAPSLVRTLAADDLDRVLVHEWAHVQRHDDVVNVLQVVIRIVAGWHPAVWWIDRRLHVEREIACDEMAVAITGSPKSYAQCLMKLSTVTRTRMAMLTAPAAFASGLRARVVKIVSPYPLLAPVWSRGLAAATVLVLCIVSVVVGGLTLVEATAFVQPSESARIDRTETRSAPSALPLPIAETLADTGSRRSPRRAVSQPPSSRRSKTPEPLPAPQPLPASTAAPASQEPKASDSFRIIEASPAAPLAIVTETPHVALATPPVLPTPAVPDVNAQEPRAPWTAAAAGGVAIGRTSKDAGLATAGFFTKVARRVAGSF